VAHPAPHLADPPPTLAALATPARRPPSPPTLPAPRPSLATYLELARVKQWVKGGFVLIGPVYGLAVRDLPSGLAVLGAFLAFGFASSACYVHNDLRDRDADRAHPRKRHRPIASGRVGVGPAYALFAFAIAAAAAALLLVPADHRAVAGLGARAWLGICVGLYVVNVLAYSWRLKHVVVMDVISLALGFVLRVLGGCAAVMVEPSSWLLNVTFFVSMFLAFGKRLGERRTMGGSAAAARGVQAAYTDDLLRMAVVVTGVATLLTYAQYVQSQAEHYTRGFNLLWLTMLPATYGLLRAMVKVETGVYDDPTELAARDRPFQLAVALFGLLTLALMGVFRMGLGPRLGLV
jgi:4-hydroxybenzoate polyprenyltransferase